MKNFTSDYINKPKILSINDLDCGFNGVSVLRSPISLTLHEGDFCILQGPNGSGKTTILKSILGVYPQISGKVQIFSRSVYLPAENYGFWPDQTIVESIMHFHQLRGCAPLEIPMELYEDFFNKKYSECSRGERQYAHLVLQLMHTEAQLAIFDEPFSHLDQTRIEKVVKFFIENFLPNKCAIFGLQQHQCRFFKEINFIDISLELKTGENQK